MSQYHNKSKRRESVKLTCSFVSTTDEVGSLTISTQLWYQARTKKNKNKSHSAWIRLILFICCLLVPGSFWKSQIRRLENLYTSRFSTGKKKPVKLPSLPFPCVGVAQSRFLLICKGMAAKRRLGGGRQKGSYILHMGVAPRR